MADGDRNFSVDRYQALDVDLAGADVLLVDDTWTTGGHAQSASWTLKQAGASKVAALVIGRHFHADFEVGDETSAERFAAIPWPFDWSTLRRSWDLAAEEVRAALSVPNPREGRGTKAPVVDDISTVSFATRKITRLQRTTGAHQVARVEPATRPDFSYITDVSSTPST